VTFTLRYAPSRQSADGILVVDWAHDSKKWNEFVNRSAESTLCHLAGWHSIMSEVLGHECMYLVATDAAGGWRGVLPLVRVKSILGHYLISLPFLNDGGPLGDDAAQEALVDFAVSEAKRSGATLMELRARRSVLGPVIPSHRKISVHLQLPKTAAELWTTTLRAKLRAQIRRAAKENMTFHIGDGQLDSFYKVFARNMRDLGTPVLPRHFFERLASTFESAVLFAAVYTPAGIPVAGACCLIWRNEIEVTWASSLREYNRLAPNMLLYCRLMEEAISSGRTLFNFGRCSPGGTTHSFKLQWGGRDIDLPWGAWSKSGKGEVPSAKRPIYRLASSAWRRLPMPVANTLGPALARLIP